MKNLLPTAALPLTLVTALFALAACDTKASREAAANDVAANQAAAQNATLAAHPMPPSIRADKSFRCKDNSLAFVTFYQGDTMAMVKDTADGTPTVLKAAKGGDPLTADGGWKMTGDEKGVSLTRPGKSAVACHV